MSQTSDPVSEILENQTSEAFPKGTLACVLGTFNKNWYEGEMKDETDVDKLRGDLALETAKTLVESGHHCIVVDGGSSHVLLNTFTELGATVQKEEKVGMSASKQQGFAYASKLLGVEIIAHLEPEKISMAKCIEMVAFPILRDEADIIIPKRNSESFRTYPPYQAIIEKRSNRLFNNILRTAGLLLPEDEDLDVWFGPRIFRNDPRIVDLFLREFSYEQLQERVGERIKPGLWSNATFFPVIAALYEGYRVKGVEIPYEHPEAQTKMELDSKNLETFIEKRKAQQRGIIIATAEFIRWLHHNEWDQGNCMSDHKPKLSQLVLVRDN